MGDSLPSRYADCQASLIALIAGTKLDRHLSTKLRLSTFHDQNVRFARTTYNEHDVLVGFVAAREAY